MAMKIKRLFSHQRIIPPMETFVDPISGESRMVELFSTVVIGLKIGGICINFDIHVTNINIMKHVTFLICVFGAVLTFSQTNIQIYPDTLQGLVPLTYKPGVFYVPKTEAAANDFYTNGIYQNSTRSYVIESVLNNTSNLDESLALMATVEDELVTISNKCEKFLLIFEKMPAWLSSSDNGAPASTPGWSILNTKPPADWEEWETVVSAMVSQLVNDFGIDNIWIEVWNEPDLGSWTGTMGEYFELYKRTYNAVKSVDESIPVGGPAVNFWANNIYWHPTAGHIPDVVADSSLIAELLDYGLENDCIPDFITWHNFNLTYQEFGLGTDYVKRKCEAISIPVPPLMISEWNAPSAIRDIPLHKAFIVQGQLEITKANLSNQMIAAWQDFEEEPGEFHADYGMLTWGGIHKPAYYSTLLFNEMEGAICKTFSDDPNVISATAFEDTVYILLANYCPPPFIEAFNHTLYEGGYNINQLDSAGFINIEAADITYLEDIYSGEIVIGDDSPMHEVINASIPIYSFYEFYETNPRTFALNLEGYGGDYSGVIYLVDDTMNNNQYQFDSLMMEGMSREEAVDHVVENQGLAGAPVNFLGGSETFSLDPNAILLIKLGVDGVGGTMEHETLSGFNVYPNPVSETLFVSGLYEETDLIIYNLQGKLVGSFTVNTVSPSLDISNLENGTYIIRDSNGKQETKKFIKQ